MSCLIWRCPKGNLRQRNSHHHKMENIWLSIFRTLIPLGPENEGVSEFLFVSSFFNRKIHFPMILQNKCWTETERCRSEGELTYLPGWAPTCLGPVLTPARTCSVKSFPMVKKMYPKLGNKAKGWQHVIWVSYGVVTWPFSKGPSPSPISYFLLIRDQILQSSMLSCRKLMSCEWFSFGQVEIQRISVP